MIQLSINFKYSDFLTDKADIQVLAQELKLYTTIYNYCFYKRQTVRLSFFYSRKAY
ncbi:hypothetical protein HDF25_002361 [Pedobacter cryoconitis]|uniref:Uncharacterized protein n=1 Tax=Pedobacter cryoconitis TaxID=188932 RepID=A0A7X0J5I4_9SPHI|nr:hypothetical protein [Pedobacter cryoconitis]